MLHNYSINCINSKHHTSSDGYGELGGKTWFKFSSVKVAHEILWYATEVEYDMHDNHHLNRIYATPDNRLVIKDFQAGFVLRCFFLFRDFVCRLFGEKIQKRLDN